MQVRIGNVFAIIQRLNEVILQKSVIAHDALDASTDLAIDVTHQHIWRVLFLANTNITHKHSQQSRSYLSRLTSREETVHIQSMIGLFVLACGIPALLRVCDMIGYGYLPIFLIIVRVLAYSMARPVLKRIEDKRTSEKNHANSEKTQ